MADDKAAPIANDFRRMMQRTIMSFIGLLKCGVDPGRVIAASSSTSSPIDPAPVKIAVLKEAAGETRVAAIPETVKKFIALGADVAVENGAGEPARISDADFEAAGAAVAGRADALKGAGIILCITGPDPATPDGADKGALLVGALDPARRADDIAAYAKAGLEALAMERMPRITRAQSMDILSSQSNLAGYKAVVDARRHLAAPSR